MCGNGPSIHKGVSNWGHWLVRSWLELGGRLKSLAEYCGLAPHDRRRALVRATQGEHHGNDTGLDHQPRAAPSRLNPCIQGFAVGVNCAAAAVIVALAGKTSAQGHHVAAIARAFWPRRSSNRRWLAHKIVQQPVELFLPKSVKVLEMPDFVGCLQFFTFSASNEQTGLKLPGKV